MNNQQFRFISIATISVWMLLFALFPLLIMLVSSFLSQGTDSFLELPFSLSAYETAFHYLYVRVFFRSFFWAGLTTIICLLMGYPFAYLVARAKERVRMLLLFFIIIPFWTSSLIRAYAMITIIKTNGLLNHWLLSWHLIKHPLHILYTPIAVQIGLVYTLVSFMILPIYANLEKFDWRLVEAARDLGASKLRAFFKIVVPISAPGIFSGCLLVFLPAMTLFFIPDILGGAKTLLLGNVIQMEFLDSRNWPLGSALSVILTLLIALLLIYYRKINTSKSMRGLL